MISKFINSSYMSKLSNKKLYKVQGAGTGVGVEVGKRVRVWKTWMRDLRIEKAVQAGLYCFRWSVVI